MDRLRAAAQCCLHDAVDVEVALPSGRRTEAHGGVGEAHMRRIKVRVAEDRDTADAQAPQGAENADRDLAAVGDEDAVKRHRALVHGHIRKTP